MNTNPLIHTKRSLIGHVFDVVLTVVGWLIFCLLFASGILSVWHGELRGPQDLVATSLFISNAHTLLIYAALALVNAAILIAWAFYNYRRFSGKGRRTPTPPLPSQQLQSSFDLSKTMLNHAHDARVMVISHEEDSTICGIEVIEQAHPPGKFPPSNPPLPCPNSPHMESTPSETEGDRS